MKVYIVGAILPILQPVKKIINEILYTNSEISNKFSHNHNLTQYMKQTGLNDTR